MYAVRTIQINLSSPCRLLHIGITILIIFWAGSQNMAAQQTLEADQLPSETTPAARGRYAHVPPHIQAVPTQGSQLVLSPASTLQTVATFSGEYVAHGLSAANTLQTHWFYQMIGTVPESGKTTTIAAPIVPVSLDLRNADGSPRFVKGHRLFYDATQFVKRVLESPLFVNAHYSSSQRATQFVDAVQRAEFFNRAKNRAWHTILKPSVKKARVMVLRAGSYQFHSTKMGRVALTFWWISILSTVS